MAPLVLPGRAYVVYIPRSLSPVAPGAPWASIMNKLTRPCFETARSAIVAQLAKASAPVLTRDDLQRIVTPENTEKWGFPPGTSFSRVIEFLCESADLRDVCFKFPARNVHRFLVGSVSTFEVVQTLKPNAYFTHYSAMFLHGLTEQIPKTIYLNFEQHLAAGGGTLTQAGIDRAFKGKCRVSHNIAAFDEFLVTVLNGANTGHLGVIDLDSSDGAWLRTTGLERTLIDATVRPVYSGGVFEVARAFAESRGRLSVPVLVTMLQKLNYTYPYHQSIGFYLERAGGYEPSEIEVLRRFPMEFDFYLDYHMRRTEYHPRWRLHVPKGF